VTYRYVQSGSCSQCVKDAQPRIINGSQAEIRNIRVDKDKSDAEARLAEDQARRIRKDVRDNLVQIRVRLYEKDLPVFKDALWGAALLRCPYLQRHDVWPNLTPSDGKGWGMFYRANCFAEDVAELKEFASNLTNASIPKVGIEDILRKQMGDYNYSIREKINFPSECYSRDFKDKK
jgi:hypothetical protein